MNSQASQLLLCGYGYLGQAVAKAFLEAGWSVATMSRSVEDDADSRPGLAHHIGDLSSSDSIHELAGSIPKPDFIVHCASSSRGGPDAYRQVFVEGCEHLTNTFPEATLLFTSSTSVYPQTDGSTVTEESPAEPERETGRLLRRAEDVVCEAGGIVFRLSGIYGPQRSYILQKFLSDEATLEEDGRRIINQIHRDDAAQAILHAASKPIDSGIYNLSDSAPRSQLSLFTELCRIFGRKMPPSEPREPNRKRGWTHKAVSNQKLIDTGWTPGHPDFLDAAQEIADSLNGD